ncbi:MULTISPECIES: PfkB family carbohydrate kinase [unclassified Mycolicibacterium]|uniref:PfkB family carbohydrate kinase n=1 Tax=unclassified Mycolicibacterium TaxID=2636767 RepID=UPI0012DC09FC|nr:MULTISPECIES: PfkB family carbohydrate kinase [unclassified Mycolicibacterium]MUL83574.1 carbohydrate kinase [Mycolicibacterium sp. CBMA 329]MUL90565.1 carbohydrate kinase [Mycolicibacterium sp. CBMA 331]MUM00535.1 carbohydrate kinase [Mycolicibacterium sp. CBMA 334]MUM25427.1 carbohydrate kinase [Mycolicibacterium sp. CBMA 295]MUM41509.1 carbohydrate kinase [Mycolicibacterium sp. CBMA 247]
MPRDFVPGVTVLGNLAIDVIDGAAPSPGGCASFAGVALQAAGAAGRIVAMGARGDHDLFDPLLARFGSMVRVLSADATSAFRLDYDDTDHRHLSVEAIGPVWSPADIAVADPDTTWVHLAPLLRTDFPGAALAALKTRGHRISYDGQGLVRADRLGPLVEDQHYPADVLRYVDILKLAEDEAAVVAGGSFDAAAAERLGVPEILVTYGSEGCDIYRQGSSVVRVPAAWRVLGVQTTGAGDMFTTCYVARRAAGVDPLAAAEFASDVVAGQLDTRVHAGAPDPA